MLVIETEPIPLQSDNEGNVHVRGTRVTLDSVIHAFSEGATAEEICQRFPTVALDDSYAVILYYLRHRNEVDAYLSQRVQDADEIRKGIDARFDNTGFRARLIARRDARKST